MTTGEQDKIKKKKRQQRGSVCSTAVELEHDTENNNYYSCLVPIEFRSVGVILMKNIPVIAAVGVVGEQFVIKEHVGM